ncbi:hypothetical protein H8Z75_17710 [Xanthomonas citri pv. citri]|nr:hypothetical protein H8Z75_17710 [Xanthomonas citri pv. citri]
MTCASTRRRRSSASTPRLRHVLTGLTRLHRQCWASPRPHVHQETHMLALNYHGSRDVRVETVPDP